MPMSVFTFIGFRVVETGIVQSLPPLPIPHSVSFWMCMMTKTASTTGVTIPASSLRAKCSEMCVMPHGECADPTFERPCRQEIISHSFVPSTLEDEVGITTILASEPSLLASPARPSGWMINMRSTETSSTSWRVHLLMAHLSSTRFFMRTTKLEVSLQCRPLLVVCSRTVTVQSDQSAPCCNIYRSEGNSGDLALIARPTSCSSRSHLVSIIGLPTSPSDHPYSNLTPIHKSPETSQSVHRFERASFAFDRTCH